MMNVVRASKRRVKQKSQKQKVNPPPGGHARKKTVRQLTAFNLLFNLLNLYLLFVVYTGL